jgi:hypothetical protein
VTRSRPFNPNTTAYQTVGVRLAELPEEEGSLSGSESEESSLFELEDEEELPFFRPDFLPLDRPFFEWDEEDLRVFLGRLVALVLRPGLGGWSVAPRDSASCLSIRRAISS